MLRTVDSFPGLVVELRERTDTLTAITVAGEIDMDNSADLLHEVVRLLPRHGTDQVDLDLGEVTFLGSAGVLALVQCREIAEQRGSRFGISQAHRNVRQVLTICQLTDLFHLTPG